MTDARKISSDEPLVRGAQHLEVGFGSYGDHIEIRNKSSLQCSYSMQNLSKPKRHGRNRFIYETCIEIFNDALFETRCVNVRRPTFDEIISFLIESGVFGFGSSKMEAFVKIVR
uniref:LAGLIDADG homing endonuclease n=1 Tax=Romanomermis culicivorax TaxID=13658 RepID=A0A915JGM8_ROMCU